MPLSLTGEFVDLFGTAFGMPFPSKQLWCLKILYMNMQHTCAPVSNIMDNASSCQDQCGDQDAATKYDQGGGPLRQLTTTSPELQPITQREHIVVMQDT